MNDDINWRQEDCRSHLSLALRVALRKIPELTSPPAFANWVLQCRVRDLNRRRRTSKDATAFLEHPRHPDPDASVEHADEWPPVRADARTEPYPTVAAREGFEQLGVRTIAPRS